jgi:ABC-2 type transport system permease protein
MSVDRILAVSSRIARQVIKDRRSVALIVLAPVLVMTLVGFSLFDEKVILNRITPALLGVFVLFFTFLLTGVSFLRERSQGTLERLKITPVSRADLLIGYLLGFLIFAMLQSAVILAYTVLVLPVSFQGEIWQVFVVLVLLTIVAVSLGILVSTFAKNEFQVVQFIPLVIVPQIFLTGVLVPVEDMPWLLENISKVLPLTYAVDMLIGIMLEGRGLLDFGNQIIVLSGFGGIFLIGASLTVKK